MYGIESLIVAIFTLFLPYIIFELNETYKKYYLMASIYIAAYYILKSIYVSTKIRNKYMNSISDVKEIVKREKTKRTIKEDLEEVEEQAKSEDKSTSNKKVKVQDKKVGKEEINIDTYKKRGRPKKENSAKAVIESKKENTTPKRRGRPKKTETKGNKNEPEGTEMPKKRGRPRKVAIVKND